MNFVGAITCDLLNSTSAATGSRYVLHFGRMAFGSVPSIIGVLGKTGQESKEV